MSDPGEKLYPHGLPFTPVRISVGVGAGLCVGLGVGLTAKAVGFGVGLGVGVGGGVSVAVGTWDGVAVARATLGWAVCWFGVPQDTSIPPTIARMIIHRR